MDLLVEDSGYFTFNRVYCDLPRREKLKYIYSENEVYCLLVLKENVTAVSNIVHINQGGVL